ncbi:uncharacterized protein TrAFT101_009718 [Trichoderma asperellum]|nr:hypothetical protein TrAFT101_009718 [Trichoderma asperellum]
MCGVKRRKEDISYKLGAPNDESGMSMSNLHEPKPGQGSYNHAFDDPTTTAYHGVGGGVMSPTGEERVGLIYDAQPNPESGMMGSSPPSAYGQHLHQQPYEYDPPPYGGASRTHSPYNNTYNEQSPPQRPQRPPEPYQGDWRQH